MRRGKSSFLFNKFIYLLSSILIRVTKLLLVSLLKASFSKLIIEFTVLGLIPEQLGRIAEAESRALKMFIV